MGCDSQAWWCLSLKCTGTLSIANRCNHLLRLNCRKQCFNCHIDMQTHAGNCRRQHSGVFVCRIWDMVTSNCAAVTVCVTLWPWPFDLWFDACRATAIEYICTKFGVDSSSRFPVTARTNRQTRLNAIPMPAAWVIIISPIPAQLQTLEEKVKAAAALLVQSS